MDDLLNVAKEVLKDFDPATDSADDFEKLPDGQYTCLLEDVTARKNDKGTNWICFKFSIIEGEYENRLIFANYYFTEKTLKRNIKRVTKIAFEFGYNLPVELFGDFNTLAESLNELAGNQAIVKQLTNKNGFSDYSINPIE